MTEISNQGLCKWLYLYELGMLGPDELDTFEIHLLECPKCRKLVFEQEQASRLLREDPEIRALVSGLGRTASEPVHASPDPLSPPPKRRRSVLYRAVALAAVIAAFLILKPWNIYIQSDDPVVAAENRVAVMSFTYLSGHEDSARMADVVTNLLITDLSESKYLQVIPGGRVMSMKKYLTLRDSTLNDTLGLQAGLREMGARWLLSGSILQMEPQIVLTAQLTDATSGAIVGSQRVTGQAGGTVFDAVDLLAARVREILLSPGQAQNEFDPSLADVTTRSAEAYRWYLEGVDLYGRKHFDEAKECYLRAVEHDSTFAMAWYCLAFHHVPGAAENAVKYSDRASHKERLYINFLEARESGDVRRAEVILRELVERYPDEKVAWMELAWLARTDVRFEEAIEYLQQSLKADPLYVDAIDLLAFVYNDLGDAHKALATIERTIAIQPDEPGPYDSRGEILAANGHLDEAVLDFERALSLKPDFDRHVSRLKLGGLYMYQRRYQEAKEALREAIAGDNFALRSQARAILSLVSLHQGKLQMATDELNDAIAADRLEASSDKAPAAAALKFFVLSRVRAQVGEYDGSVAALEEGFSLAQQAGGSFLDIYTVHYAFALAVAGKADSSQSAIAQLRSRLTERGARLDPLWKAEGITLYASKRYREAIERLQRIVDPNWLSFDTRFVLARAYLETGQYSDAIEVFEKALTNFADLRRLGNALWAAEAVYYLALAQESAGDRASAVRNYEKFLEIWAGADSSLTLVNDASERLSRLKSET
ncbi:MAG: tetratricopeptide repeat protein [Candidatus Zixiibacteriota bacterium]|nr:MAG: tetratricopeptide repeat protein [candidate division Zixibacteria bacterium]